MGKFAAIYDLPAGEQMLVTIYSDPDDGPTVKYDTEVAGEIISAEIPLCKEGSTYLERMAAMEEARSVIFQYTEDDIKEFRRRFVKGTIGQGQEVIVEQEERICRPN